MKQAKHWQDPVSAVIGAWLIVSPWVLGFQGEVVAMVNAVVIGVALIAVALGAVLVPSAWEEWTEFALGLWLIASPWLLGFATLREAGPSAVIAGTVAAAFALWILWTDKDFSGRWRKWLPH